MTKDYYTPRTDGIAGNEEFGDGEGEHAHFGGYRPRGTFVTVGGVKLTGRVSEPEAVAKFIRDKGIKPTVRLEQVYCTPTAPDTIATRVDRRRGWRWEAVVGLPDEFRGPARIARGAHRFTPGWDSRQNLGNAGTDVISGTNELGSPSSNLTSRKVVIRDPQNDGE